MTPQGPQIPLDDPAAAAPRRRVMPRPWRYLLAAVIPAVLLFFVGRNIWRQWDTIEAFAWNLDARWLAASAVAFWADFVILIALWRVFLSTISNKKLSLITSYQISALSNLGKYVPGKVWAVLGIVYFLKRRGYSATEAVAATGLHQAYTVVAGLLFVSAVLGSEIWGRLPLVSVLAGLGLAVVVIYPPVFSCLFNRALALFKREPLPYTISFGRAFLLLLAYVGAWILYGASFWCMLKGIGIDNPPFWSMAAASSAAYLLGFLALFAPGGLGVREGILLVLITPHIPAGLAATVTVIARVWITIVELIGLLPVVRGIRDDPAGPPQQDSATVSRR